MESSTAAPLGRNAGARLGVCPLPEGIMVLLKRAVETFPMRRFCLAACLVFAAAPAWAQKVTISGVDCRKLVRHQPAPDVTYKPGVDVKGRKVAPADVNDAPQIEIPETITFDAAVDLRRFGIPASSPLFQPYVGIGRVDVHQDGRVFLNGERLGNPEIAALEELCRAPAKKPR